MDMDTWATGTSTRFFDNTGELFNLYQTEGGNFMHRPIFGASVLFRSKLFRITSTPAIFLDDTTGLSDFYNFGVKFGRYKAISL